MASTFARPIALVVALLLGALVLSVPRAPAGLAAPNGAQAAPSSAGGSGAPEASAAPGGPPAIGLRVLQLTDHTRALRLPGGRIESRTLLTYVRYPALGPAGQSDLPDAPPMRSQGPLPLIVFAHGFAVTPGIYTSLLRSWARAGYVVAAPVFPLENANAPGGPDESDLINEPADMSFVITRLLGSAAGPLARLVDPLRIAVAGHSDGAEAALATAYSSRFHDPRVGAAMIFSGAEMGGVGKFIFPGRARPLLASQGTADPINEPRFTYQFFKTARRPKYLLRLLGARHRPPYTYQQPQLATVEHVTIAFLDTYLKRVPGGLERLISLGSVPGVAALASEP